MSAFKVNLTITQGETLAKRFTWSIGTLEANTPVDLTGYTARMQVRSRADSVDVLFALTTENGGIVLGGTAGDITLAMSATATAALDFRKGVYDLEVVLPDGVTVRRLMQGSVHLSDEVTR